MLDWQALLQEQTALIEGAILSFSIIAWTLCVSFALVIGLSAINTKGTQPFKKMVQAYVTLFKHLPVLVVIYFLYKALPSMGLILPPLVCGIVGLSLQASAYMVETLKSALRTIPQEQWETSVSLGLSPAEGFISIILPQLWASLLPPLASMVVNIVKNSSLLAFISVAEFFYVVYKGGVTFFHYIEFFTIGVVFYLSLNYLITFVFSLLEKVLVKTPKTLSSQKLPLQPIPVLSSKTCGVKQKENPYV